MTKPQYFFSHTIKRGFDFFIAIITILFIVVVILTDAFSHFPVVTVLVATIYLVSVILLRKKFITNLKASLLPFKYLQSWADLSRTQGEVLLITYNLKEQNKHLAEHSVLQTIAQLQQQLHDANNNDGRVDLLIREQALLDSETGIGNREFFTNRLEAYLLGHEMTLSKGLDSQINAKTLQTSNKENNNQDIHYHEDIRGAVILIQCKEGELIQSLYGKQAALDVVEALVMAIKYRLQHLSHYFIARRNTFELALLLPGIYADEIKKLSDRLLKNLSAQNLPVGINQDEFIHMGVTCFKQHHKAYQILAEADMALRSAQLQGPSQWFMYDNGEVVKESAKGSLQWRTFLQHAIDNNAFVLFFQPVISSESQQILHHEVLAKVRDKQGQLVSARVFLPMANKCGLATNIDMLIFEQTCRLLSYEKNLKDACSLNLSIESLLSKPFMQSLTKKLAKNKNVAKRLIIEVSEYHIVRHIDELVPILQSLQQQGVKILADKVGQYIESANYLTICPISYVKLHQSIVLKVHRKPENQVFIRSLKTICDQQNIKVYGLGVESFEEWQSLIHLGVDGGQGHFFTEPVAQVSNAIAMP